MTPSLSAVYISAEAGDGWPSRRTNNPLGARRRKRTSSSASRIIRHVFRSRPDKRDASISESCVPGISRKTPLSFCTASSTRGVIVFIGRLLLLRCALFWEYHHVRNRRATDELRETAGH